MGQLPAARAALADISEAEHNTSDIGLASAAIHLADCAPEQAVDVLAP